tara:strand:- start:32 stop:229 length:198 start_codon:yes stop_codon:yes gene_type:complete
VSRAVDPDLRKSDLHQEVSPKERIKERFKACESIDIAGLTISGNTEAIETMAEVARPNFEAQPKG